MRQSRALPCQRGLTEPVLEPDLALWRVVARNECALVHFDAVVAPARVRDHFTRVVPRAESPPDQFVEAMYRSLSQKK